MLSLAGCREAAIRHNTRYTALLRQEMPTRPADPGGRRGRRPPPDSWGRALRRPAHKGIDIFAPRNTPIRSATEGDRRSRAMRGLGGHVVNVLGPGGYRHYYAHLED